jgi:AbrB family looped-hinge helix DNA binding protein
MPKQKNQPHQKRFYGTANLGEKGQVVIPNDARKDMKIKKGDRLLVFGMGEDMIALIKLSQIEKIATRLSEKLKMIDDIIKRTK